MPVNFLSVAQRKSYGHYSAPPTPEELCRFFHISDDDRLLINRCYGPSSKIGFAIQLGTVRFLGTFLDDPMDVPASVLQTMEVQLGINDANRLQAYRSGRQHWKHSAEIKRHYGYCDFTDPKKGFRLCRWLCSLCWTGTDRPRILFERAKFWLLANKVLLPGVSTLERLVSQVRTRMDARLWKLLIQDLNLIQIKNLDNLLIVSESEHHSLLDQLRSGPTRISAPALVGAVTRLQEVRNLEIKLPAVKIPHIRLSTLSRIAS